MEHVSSKSNNKICSNIFAELKDAKRRKKRMQEQIKHEEALAASLKIWNTEILKEWDTM